MQGVVGAATRPHIHNRTRNGHEGKRQVEGVKLIERAGVLTATLPVAMTGRASAAKAAAGDEPVLRTSGAATRHRRIGVLIPPLARFQVTLKVRNGEKVARGR